MREVLHKTDFSEPRKQQIIDSMKQDKVEGIEENEAYARSYLEHMDKQSPSDLHNKFLAISYMTQGSPTVKSVIWSFVQADWEVLEVAEPLSFIVSDNVGITVGASNENNFRGSFDFYFPLNSFQCLHISKRSRPIVFDELQRITYRTISEPDLRKINLEAASISTEEIWGCSSEIVKQTRRDLFQNV